MLLVKALQKDCNYKQTREHMITKHHQRRKRTNLYAEMILKKVRFTRRKCGLAVESRMEERCMEFAMKKVWKHTTAV